jgi:starch phosphorylase
MFQPLVDHLIWHDDYLLLADYAGYIACQEQAGQAYRDSRQWTRMSILNVARMGKFSSDRTIAEYCRDIWRAAPMAVEV